MCPGEPGEPALAFPRSDRFELVGELGRGGMGVVYEVRDRDRGVRLALKGVRDLRSRELLRLKTEFRALRDLHHPNLVRLGELFEQDGACFFTMELVDGVDLLRWLRPGVPAPRPASPPFDSAQLSGDTRTAADPIGAMRVEARRAAAARPRPDDITTMHPRDAMSGEPDDAPDHRRGSVGPVDATRLRGVFRGLITAIAVLHRAGMVHRDIKPSNILVEDAGRVVLLDFGVVAASSDPSPDDVGHREVVGTYAYMAPEQATGTEVGPAADWYSMGVVLFEAITGRLPFPTGRAGLHAKLAMAAPPVRALVPDAPADLVALCEGLLRREPAARPAEPDILAAFGIEEEHLSDGGDTTPSGPFVGRAAELASLQAAFELAGRQATASCVFLGGESGIGKTAVMRQFIGTLRDRRGDVLVLSSRCDERELVPYNAFDGVVDGLAHYLGTIAPSELKVPDGCAALVRLFPVLRGVETLARAADRAEPHGQTGDERSTAFIALWELLAFLSTRRRVVLAIDDIHWADLDSLALLAELMSGPEAPPLFLIATARQAPDQQPCSAATVVRAPSRHIQVRGLGAADAERLLRALAPDAALDPAQAGRLIDETAGHPLFLSEMVRRLAALPQQGAVLLDDALWQRTGELAEGARTLLEIVALASTSLELGAAADAAGLAPDRFSHHLGELRAARLVRLTGTRDRDAIEPYHDRVREAIAARLPAPRRVAVHRSLAAALERRGAAVEVLAYHFAAAGERERGAAFAEAAARRAIASLAFERAAVWLRATIETSDLPPERRRGLLGELGDMLAKAGRTGDAARAFLEAAEVPQTSDDARRELHRRAAEQYLTGGHLTEGLATSRLVLGEVGLGFPETTSGAVARIGWYRTRLGLSRLRWPVRDAEQLDAHDRMRIDLCFSVGGGLAMLDSVRGAVFAFRGPLLAMSAGDPARIGRALSAAVVGAAGMGMARMARRLLEAAQRAATETDDPDAAFYAELAAVFPRFYLDNDWRGTLAAAEHVTARWGGAGRGHTFELDVVEQHHLWSLAMLGELAELRRRVPQTIRAAQRIGNRYVEISLRTWFPHVELARDRPAAALADVEDAIASWLPGESIVSNPYFFAMKSRTMVALYQGLASLGEPAIEALCTDWQRVRASMLYRIPVVIAETEQYVGLIAAARALLARANGDQAAARTHLATGARCVARMRKVAMPVLPILIAQVEASLAHAAGDVDRAVAVLRAALPAMEERGQRSFAASARWQLGRTLGGDDGARLVREAERYFDGEAIARGDRIVAMMLPGWPHPG